HTAGSQVLPRDCRTRRIGHVHAAAASLGTVALRQFTDERGRDWTVWDVHPTLAERRRTSAGPPRGMRERRRHVDARPRVSASMSSGWLAFEARDGERRRLAPIPDLPDGWAAASTDQLREWCARANPAPPARRLIE